MFRLKLFGGASVEGPDGPLTGRAVQRRRLALLALLALARGRGFARDKLVAYLWPDSNVERARHLLSDSVYRINQALGGEAIVAVGDELRLSAERLPSDADEFGEAMETGDWKRAVELHSAPLLDGFYLTGADEFERWVEMERQHHARERSRALEAVAEAAQADPAQAARWWRMLAAADPYSSRIALQLMRALERAGERAAAVQHARIHTVLVREDLGVEPDAEVLSYADRLRATDAVTQRPDSAVVAAVQSFSERAIEPVADDSPLELSSRVQAEPAAAIVERVQSRASRRPRLIALASAAGLIALALVLAAIARGGPRQPTPAGPTAIVVLPFADQSPAGDQEYFADGITEELIVKLSKVDGLRLVGRTSAFAFKGKAADAREIGASLNVSAILTGSVRKAANRLRVTAQLVDASNGYELWSETYERELEDVFAIQDDISHAIVTRLRGRLTGSAAARLATSSTEDANAYNLYLNGRFEWHKRTEQGLRNAVEYFGQAVARAPEYARAHVGLADAYAVLGFYDYLPPREAFPRAQEAARRAVQLDATLAEPHATLGYVALYYEWDWELAEREFTRTIELDPGYSTGHQWYANFLTAMGRFDEAVREMRAAQQVDPLSLIANAGLGWVLYYAGDYERAIDQCSRTLELNPNFELAHLWRGLAREELGRTDEEMQDLQRAEQLSSGSAISKAALARAHALSGDRDRALGMLRELEQRGGAGYVPSFEIAKIYEALGDRASALLWLRRAYEQRSHSMVFLAVDPQLEALGDDPEFQRLVRDVGLDHRPTPPPQ